MIARPFQAGICLVALLYSTLAPAQQPAQPSQAPASPAPQTAAIPAEAVAPPPASSADRRRAAKLFLTAGKQFQRQQFEAAMQTYAQAAKLDPSNQDYTLATQLARNHAVAALVQAAAKARTQGDAAAATSALEHARALDPSNSQVAQHIQALAVDAAPPRPAGVYTENTGQLDEGIRLAPSGGTQSFHLRTDRRQLIQRVYRAFGIEPSIDQSVPAPVARFDLDDASFAQAQRILGMATDTFAVPLDSRHVVVARDTPDNHRIFDRQETETIYLPGFSTEEITEINNIAKNVFSVQQVAVEASANSMTLRAPARTLDAFNSTMQELVNSRGEVMLDVRIFELAHTRSRTTGLQPPQQLTAFNVYAEEQAIFSANQDLIAQIIASGLAAPGDTLAILGILMAAGQVPTDLFNNGVALFGGGLTLTGVSPGPTQVSLNLNSSDSRTLENIRLRLSDGKDETLRSGVRYPIQVAAFTGLSSNNINIPGLTSAGSSSGLSSILNSLTGSTDTSIPQVQYQDLGLTLKATPRIMRSGDVALTLDLKITALTGATANDMPVLDNRSYSGVITVKEGQTTMLLSELNEQETRALSGVPGLSEIPGLSNVTQNAAERDYATLLIMLTPHLLRGPEFSGHTRMIRIERGLQAQ